MDQLKGLTDEQVEASRRKHGKNVLTPPRKVSLWKLFFSKFSDPLIIVLMVIGVFAVGVSCYEYWGLGGSSHVFFEPIGIFVAIALATGLGFYFERKAQKEFTVLNKENDREPTTVIRNGSVMEIPKCDVVVGDVLVLSTGQELPADARLMEAFSLMVDESSLTGEPVHMKSAQEKPLDTKSTYPQNMVYRGTQIMEGHGMAVVTAVGDNTENGKIMQSLTADDADAQKKERAKHLEEKNRVTRKMKTPLDEQLGSLSVLVTNLSYAFAGIIIVSRLLVYFDWSWQAWILAIPTAFFFYLVIFKFRTMRIWHCAVTVVVFFAIFIAAVVWLHNLLLPEENLSFLLAYALNTIMIAVTLVVVAVPEGLPMAVSLSLANSMRKMLKTNNLVRKMHACETMGASTVICTDKTGTLTQNVMQVRATSLADSPFVKEGMAVNSTASLDFNTEVPHVVGNPTEGALLLWLWQQKVDYRVVRQKAIRMAELPFSTERKLMATVVRSAVKEGAQVLYVKGAPEILLDLCSGTLSTDERKQYLELLSDYQNKAMRTLGFAYRELEAGETPIQKGQLDAGPLQFLGIVGIEDPVREDVREAVQSCLNAGIDVKIVTGDTMATAREIGRQIGIWDDSCSEKNIIDGRSMDDLSDEKLQDRVNDLRIISRARPLDKKRLVEALQANNHVVAVTGDGTNDAPALHAAHVGLSMGAGTSVAKEASDITIIDNSFASIARAVKWGRSLYQNIQRFLLYQLTVNVAACFLVLVGAFLGTESPLTVTQMLWVNLIMDTFAAFALSALPPSDRVMQQKPRDRKAFILDKMMLENIWGVGLFFFFLLVVLLYIFQHADIHSLTDLLHLSLGPKGHVSPYEQTLLFTIFVMTHFWYLFNARAFRTNDSGLNLRDCDQFLTIATIILVGQVLMVQLPVVNIFFNVVPLSLTDWVIIIILSSLVLWVRELWSLMHRRK